MGLVVVGDYCTGYHGDCVILIEGGVVCVVNLLRWGGVGCIGLVGGMVYIFECFGRYLFLLGQVHCGSRKNSGWGGGGRGGWSRGVCGFVWRMILGMMGSFEKMRVDGLQCVVGVGG